ncbi:MAG: type 4a pilus biogenesis protein PilO [Candidatus Marinimicrobia bacterium]|nr:type 4a pilus biogenesis protein PilO [Candidatus Neomarinimicrobiota bacterium]MCF7923220.1 type 4a pilus biogenesis protein PilO [Candidatus Neomarinimicrobiota bacterium]
MNRNIFFGTIIFLVLATSGWFYYTVAVSGTRISELKLELKGINDRFDELAGITESYDEFKIRFMEKVEQFDTLKTIIPGNQGYGDVLEQIRQISERHKLQILSFDPSLNDTYPALYTEMKIPINHVECYPLQIKFYGDFLTIGAFLDDLLEMDKLVNIANIKLETEMQYGGMLTCELNLYTYIFIQGA